jgi:hypothetical protein
MNFVINGIETCGVIRDIAQELRSEGHRVVTVSDQNRFFRTEYNFEQTNFLPSFLAKFFGISLANFLAKAFWHTNLYSRFDLLARKFLLRECNFYLQISAGTPYQKEILEHCRIHGIPSAVFLLGTDVRDYSTFVKHFDVGDWTIPPPYLATPKAEKVRVLREVEQFADAIFSVPDQMSLAKRPYYHLQIPLVLDNFKPIIHARDIPKVVHAPSNSEIKGTSIIESTLDRLQNEGIAFEYTRLQGVDHERVLTTLSDSDILIDEVILHGPGWLSMEAMASGCAVATKYFEASPPCFRPPVIQISHRDIYQKLKELLTDKSKRVELAKEGLGYIGKNAIELVLHDVILKAQRPQNFPPDYIPDQNEFTE